MAEKGLQIAGEAAFIPAWI